MIKFDTTFALETTSSLYTDVLLITINGQNNVVLFYNIRMSFTTVRDKQFDSLRVASDLIAPVYSTLPVNGYEGAIAYQQSDENVYYHDSTQWRLFTGIQGSQGFQGAQGFQGFRGAQGFQGFQGAQGEAGSQGSQGLQGFQGSQGGAGAQGFQGGAGSQGFQGTQGAQGSQGSQGRQGAQGIQGIFAGAQGAQGGLGIQGAQGFQGGAGAQGSPGEEGPTGSSTIEQFNALIGIIGPGVTNFSIGDQNPGFGPGIVINVLAVQRGIFVRAPRTGILQNLHASIERKQPGTATGTITFTVVHATMPPDPSSIPFSPIFSATPLTLAFAVDTTTATFYTNSNLVGTMPVVAGDLYALNVTTNLTTVGITFNFYATFTYAV